jgi:hypothetical protein
MNNNRSFEPLCAVDLEIRHNLNSKIARGVCELIDDVGLKVFQHAIPLTSRLYPAGHRDRFSNPA